MNKFSALFGVAAGFVVVLIVILLFRALAYAITEQKWGYSLLYVSIILLIIFIIL